MSLPIRVQELGATGSLKVKFANSISSMDPDHDDSPVFVQELVSFQIVWANEFEKTR